MLWYKLYHKVGPDRFEPWKPSSKMKLVYAGYIDESPAYNTPQEGVFHVHNMDDRPGVTKIRSMCVGDVVVIENRPGGWDAWACESVGWRKIPHVIWEFAEEVRVDA